MPKDSLFGIIQRLQNKVPTCFGNFLKEAWRNPEFRKSSLLWHNQIPLKMQTEVTELQNREITRDGFN
jgi:hypothetical protein